MLIKWSGSVYNAQIFANSTINKAFTEEKSQNILGDPAYPLLPFLMKEFPGGGNTGQERFFGYRLSSARMVIESSFGRLKARFGALKREME